MDRERFDQLARLLAARGSRRGALGTILGVAFLGHDPDEGLAKPGKGKGKGHAKGRGMGHDKGKGKGHTERDEPEDDVARDAAPAPEDDGPDVQAEGQGGGQGKSKGRGKGKGKNRKGRNQKGSGDRTQNAQAEAIPTNCCGTLSCAKPTKGSNRQKCNYAGQDLSGISAQGASMAQVDGRGTIFSTAAKPSDWGGVSFYKACLQNSKWNGAELGGANFDQACLFDADLSGADVDNSTNTASAKFCRTTLWDGTISNRDCNKGTACCPACDETHPCANGQICCNGRCRTGDCCVVGDCPDEQCQTKACTGFNCEYTPITNGPGPLCNTICCGGICCPSGQVCVRGQCIACNAETCPNGCCDAQDICQVGNTNQVCGTGGEDCVSCPAGNACVNGDCVCTAASCPNGCCSNGPGNPGTCQPGNTSQNCGTGGELCETCPAGEACVGGNCVCNATSCPNGCCDTAAGPCLPGNTVQNCGTGGETCEECPAGNACVGGNCVCNAASCPNGCCSNGPGTAGSCLPGNTNANCGTGGELCDTCTGQEQCVNGNCDCQPNCDGRECGPDGCDGQCPPGCPQGEICTAQGQCICTATSCPNGCCDTAAGPCLGGNTDDNCGTGGETCEVCAAGTTCVGGNCVCNELSCPNGCCSNGPGNVGACQTSSNTTCGTGGETCVNCPAGNVCVAGDCVCNATSCPSGCCSNGPGVAGTCQTSSNATCGTGGEQCTACPAGNVCVGGDCVCTAASCPNGCCSNGPGNAGTCQTSSNDTCGINGVLCVDCPGSTPFCSASGICVACLTPANCPTPPTCSVATCTAGVCGTAPLQNQQGPGCNGAGQICCNGFCVNAQQGQCPICCQNANECPPGNQCVGSGACEVGGIDTCVVTTKCCRP